MAYTDKNDNSDYDASFLSTLFAGVWLALLMVIFVVISTHGVENYYYNSDEMSHIDIAKGDTLQRVLQFSLHETHPPLGHILRYYWLMISGTRGFARSLSLIFGIGLIPLYYHIGKLLHGKFTGLCCAALIGFSHGVIIQSYLVRNYTIFLFLLSLSFYYYLRWRHDPSFKTLLCYAAFGCLACLTHFSGIFAIVSIAAYEMIAPRPLKADRRMLLVNVAIVAITAIALHLWQDTNAPNAFQIFQDSQQISHASLLLYLLVSAALFPLFVSYYILPSQAATWLIALLLPFIAARNKTLRSFLLLMCIALGIGMLLVGGGIYPFLTSRRNLWILPFIVTAAGWAIASIGERGAEALAKKMALPWLQCMAIIILIMGWGSYNPTARFAEKEGEGVLGAGVLKEYDHPVADPALPELERYLSTLDDTYLLIAARADIFLLSPASQNPYAFMEDNANRKDSVTAMPYFHTHILFPSTYYPPDPINILQKGPPLLIKNADNLVFISTSSAPSIAMELILCPLLRKNIIAFPPAGEKHVFTREEILSTPALLLIVSKKEFFEQFVSPSGKAHGCHGSNH